MVHFARRLNSATFAANIFGDGAALIGLGTHTGRVAAASDWAVRRRSNACFPLGDNGQNRFLLEFSKDKALQRRLSEQRLERFIGVIYRPDTEPVQTLSLSQQFVVLDKSDVR
jgi:erythromycin esterase-like protein